MNGCGDIEIKYIPEEVFKNMHPSQKEWITFSFMQSIANTCRNRPKVCDKKYVRVYHVMLATVGVVGALVGLGIIQVQVFMPALIKKAVAAAIG